MSLSYSHTNLFAHCICTNDQIIDVCVFLRQLDQSTLTELVLGYSVAEVHAEIICLETSICLMSCEILLIALNSTVDDKILNKDFVECNHAQIHFNVFKYQLAMQPS